MFLKSFSAKSTSTAILKPICIIPQQELPRRGSNISSILRRLSEDSVIPEFEEQPMFP